MKLVSAIFDTAVFPSAGKGSNVGYGGFSIEMLPTVRAKEFAWVLASVREDGFGNKVLCTLFASGVCGFVWSSWVDDIH